MLEQRQVADEEWRRDVNRRLDEHFERIEEGDGRMTALETKLDTNNAMTGRIERNTAELLEIFDAVRGFGKVASWLGGTVKWIAALLIALGVIVYVWKTGDLPKKP